MTRPCLCYSYRPYGKLCLFKLIKAVSKMLNNNSTGNPTFMIVVNQKKFCCVHQHSESESAKPQFQRSRHKAFQFGKLFKNAQKQKDSPVVSVMMVILPYGLLANSRITKSITRKLRFPQSLVIREQMYFDRFNGEIEV